MPLPQDFLSSLEYPSTEEIFTHTNNLRGTDTPRAFLELRNELKPIDLFCYLWARFGPPNGIQNFLRKNHSDNLVHWDWTLKYREVLIGFWGTNFRTDLFVIGELNFGEPERLDLINQVKTDLRNHGTKMAALRGRLEHWTEFVNPYWRLTRAINSLRKELSTLDLNSPFSTGFNTPSTVVDQMELWESVSEAHSRAFGLCFGIRSMLPVWAEAFVNLLIFVQARSDIKADPRLLESIFRQHIDVRVRGLHINCVGFEKSVDYSSDACKNFHRLANQRNDLLHGNIVPEKQKFNEVFFLGNVPVFKEYRSLWERSIAVGAKAAGLDQLHTEIKTVVEFVEYVLSCLKPEIRKTMIFVIEKRDLAKNTEDGRFGVLFPDHLVDSRPWFKMENSDVTDQSGNI